MTGISCSRASRVRAGLDQSYCFRRRPVERISDPKYHISAVGNISAEEPGDTYVSSADRPRSKSGRRRGRPREGSEKISYRGGRAIPKSCALLNTMSPLKVPDQLNGALASMVGERAATTRQPNRASTGPLTESGCRHRRPGRCRCSRASPTSGTPATRLAARTQSEGKRASRVNSAVRRAGAVIHKGDGQVVRVGRGCRRLGRQRSSRTSIPSVGGGQA